MNNLTIETKSTAVADFSTDELRSELGRALQLTAEALAYAAEIWQELTERGEDLSDLRSGLSTYLPQIARRELSPRALIGLLDRRSILARVARAPIDEQETLIDAPICVVSEHGEEHRQLLDLAPSEALRVIDENGRVRSPEEQRARLKTRRQRARPATPKIDLDGDVIIIAGTMRIDRAYLLRQLDRLGARKN